MPAVRLRQFGYNLFKAAKVPSWHYKPVVDGLVWTSLRGVDSHGIRLLPHYLEAIQVGRINRTPNFSFKVRAQSVGIFDADHGFGITAGTDAIKKAINLAKKSGVGAVSVLNSSHFGAAAIFSTIAANQNMIGISMTHTASLVLPFGATSPFFGTNPICVAFPCLGEEPICLDMATSQVAWNKILLYRQRKKKLDSFWAADEKGRMTTDSEKAVNLFPLGGYKGYGLAFMVEVFCSLLSQMDYGPYLTKMYPVNKKRRKLGHFFMAIDIDKFVSASIFKKRMKKMVLKIRRLPHLENYKQSFSANKVMVPGDPEKEIFKARSKSGIPLSQEEAEIFGKMARESRIKLVI